MSSTEAAARSSLCFSGCGRARCHLSVLRSAAIPMVLGLLPDSGLAALPSGPEPQVVLLWDAKGRFGVTLPWVFPASGCQCFEESQCWRQGLGRSASSHG